MKWPKKCSSSDFDMACVEYDRSELESINITPLCEETDKIYVSMLSRSVHTAEILFSNKKYYEMPEIGEVPLKSFMDKLFAPKDANNNNNQQQGQQQDPNAQQNQGEAPANGN